MFYVAAIKALRIANGLSQKQVADYLHVDRSTYAYIELGRTRMHVETLVSLAEFYQVSLDTLVYGKPKMNNGNDNLPPCFSCHYLLK